DGRFVAYACLESGSTAASGSGYNIWIHDNNLPTNNAASESPLIQFPTTLELRPAFSPDGKYIAFVTAGPGAKADIAIMDLSSKVVHPLTKSVSANSANFSNFD